MKKSSPYLVAVTLDVPGAIFDEATDTYIDCYGLTILGKFNATSPEHAKDLAQTHLPEAATGTARESLFFQVLKLAETTE